MKFKLDSIYPGFPGGFSSFEPYSGFCIDGEPLVEEALLASTRPMAR